MSLQSILTKLFGNKSTRDLKEIKPIVDKINAIGPTLHDLTNDELRGKIDTVRAREGKVFKANLKVRGKTAKLRARVGGEKSLVWKQRKGRGQ